MDQHESLLELAQRHVADAEVRVMRQKALVAHLAQLGLDTEQAEKLLDTFERVLDSMRLHVQTEAEHVRVRRGISR